MANGSTTTTRPTFSPAELARLKELLDLHSAHKLTAEQASAWIRLLVSKGRTPDLTAQEFEEWLRLFTRLFIDAILSDVSASGLERLGAVPSLAAQDANAFRTYGYGLLSRSADEQRRLAAQKAVHHVRQIRQLANTMQRAEAIRQYFAAQVPGAQPPSVAQLQNAFWLYATASGENVPNWRLPVHQMRKRIEGVQRLTGSTSFATVFGIHYFLSGDFDGALAAAETVQVLLGPLAAHGEARGQRLTPQGPAQARDRGAEIAPPRGGRSQASGRGNEPPTRGIENRKAGQPERAITPVQRDTVNRAGTTSLTARAAPAKPAGKPPSQPPAKPPSMPSSAAGAKSAGPASAGPKPAGAGAAKPPKPAAGPPPELRELMASTLRNDSAAVEAAWTLFRQHPEKLSRDAATVTRIAELYRTTRNLPTAKGENRTYVQSRADAGELRTIVQLLRNPAIKRVRLLQAVQEAGSRTPDLVTTAVVEYQGKTSLTFSIEITTVTGAASRVRTRGHTPTTAPPEERGKPADVDRVVHPSAVVEAVRRKLNRQQAVGGVIVVNMPYQTDPPFGPAHRAAIATLWQTHPKGKGTVLEVWVVLPGTAPGTTRLRVVAGGGLGLASK